MIARLVVGLILSPVVVVGLAGDHPGEGKPVQDVQTVEHSDQKAHTDTASSRVISVKVSRPATAFDAHTDAAEETKEINEECGVTTTPCHIPVEVYEAQQPTLRQLVIEYFDPADWGWAIRVAFCESSAQPGDWYSDAVAPSSGSTGWFQHLPQYWKDRSSKAGFSGFPANHPVANVGVAAWLLYSTPQGKGHWWPSKHCWEAT